MIIKSISLKNFRQFKDVTISFAHDEEKKKNVTILMGDNGTGKTTLAQAFQWVLYGKTEFQDGELINRQERDRMYINDPINGKKRVCVALDIFYNKVDYTIERSIWYKKNVVGKVESMDGKFVISYCDGNGNKEYVPERQKPHLIKKILPEDLSHFFFFDGERIEKMSKELQKGKSDSFKSAVYGLVGLTAVQNALSHLKEPVDKKYSGVKAVNVIDSLKKELNKNTKSAKKLAEYNEKIEEKETEITKKEVEKESLAREQKEIQEKIEKNKKIVLSQTDKIKIKEEYQKIEKEIPKKVKERNQRIAQNLFQGTGMSFYRYLIKPLMEKAKPVVDSDIPDEKVIAGLTKKTIEALLKNGKCICGTCLNEGSLAYQEVKNLLPYSYPKTIASLKDDYNKNFTNIEKEKPEEYFSNYCQQVEEILKFDGEIEGIKNERDKLMDQLADTTDGEQAIKENEKYAGIYEQNRKKMISIEAGLLNLKQERDRIETEKSNLIIVDEGTRKYRRYLEYATALYEKLLSSYKRKEESYRLKLQSRMNKIFSDIYDGNSEILLNEDYQLNVRVKEEDVSEDEVEKNTAQGYALVFAFISAIISLAKEKLNEDALTEKDMVDIDKEGYPMVMDAPLSAFDKTRIKKICTEIPRIADQVIVFIKDTDGEIADQYMSEKIGKRYIISKVNDSSLYSQIGESDV